MRIFLLTAILLILPIAARAELTEAQIRDELAAQGHEFFLTERFSDLDYLAAEYLRSGSRTNSGQWMIDKMHSGILSTVECGCKDEGEVIAMEERALRWLSQNPDSPTAHFVYASALRKHAWYFRGNGYARDVRPESWKPYHDYLDAAAAYLLERKDALSGDPRWYATMLTIATDRGASPEDFSALLQEATEMHPYYYDIYYEAIRYFSPKWNGNAVLLEGLANYAVSKTQGEEGTALYARIYWSASDVQFGHDLVARQPEVWAAMRRGFSDMIESYPDQWNIINFARFACVAGDSEYAARLFPAIDEALVDRAWGKYGPNYDKCRQWAMGT